MLAAMLKVPELELDEAEAKRLEQAIKKVQRHYPLSVSQKHADLLMLGAVATQIYGTRAVAIYMTRKTPASAPQAPLSVVR